MSNVNDFSAIKYNEFECQTCLAQVTHFIGTHLRSNPPRQNLCTVQPSSVDHRYCVKFQTPDHPVKNTLTIHYNSIYTHSLESSACYEYKSSSMMSVYL